MSTTVQITQFGATGDGLTINTEAFAAAIERCAQGGGGTVLVPAGTFLTGPIRLKSNVELHLAREAVVVFSPNRDDYPLVWTLWEGKPTVRCISPIWGEDLCNVAITGQGIFDGNGQVWRPVKKFKKTAEEWAELLACGGVVDERGEIWWPTEAAMRGEKLVKELHASGRELHIEDFAPARDFLRPNLLKLTRCRGVRLDGPTFRNSPAWTLHLLLCENIEVRNVTVLAPWWAQNADGLDLEHCRNVAVRDSHFDVGDDAICLKSGRGEHARRLNRPTENVVIANCTVLRAHGGVVIGSEMSGGVRNVHVTNCQFHTTDIGLRFKTARGRGGVVENIDVANCVMSDIRNAAISFSAYYAVHDPRPEPTWKEPAAPVDEGTPILRHFGFRNIVCRRASRAIEMRGLPEMPIEKVSLDNIHIRARRGALLNDVKDISLADVRLEVEDPPAVECHNARNLTMRNFEACGQ